MASPCPIVSRAASCRGRAIDRTISSLVSRQSSRKLEKAPVRCLLSSGQRSRSADDRSIPVVKRQHMDATSGSRFLALDRVQRARFRHEQLPFDRVGLVREFQPVGQTCVMLRNLPACSCPVLAGHTGRWPQHDRAFFDGHFRFCFETRLDQQWSRNNDSAGITHFAYCNFHEQSRLVDGITML